PEATEGHRGRLRVFFFSVALCGLCGDRLRGHGSISVDGDFALWEAARFADVGAGAEVDGDAAAGAELGVAGSQPGGELHRVARQAGDAVGVADDHVRARIGGDVEPEVSRRADLKGEYVVVRRG